MRHVRVTGSGTLLVVLVALLGSGGLVRADSFAYEATGSDNFGRIDLTSGVYTQIGFMGQLLSGLGQSGGALYGGLYNSNILYSVNSANGQLTNIGTGSSTLLYEDTGSTTSGLYGLGKDFNLYSINPTNGSTTLIGPTGLSSGTVFGLSDNSSNLYLTVDSTFYQLNTTNGQAMAIGTMTGGINVGAMVLENGTLYAGTYSHLLVDIIDPATAAASGNTPVTGTTDTFWGLAPAPAPTPLPKSSLAGLALLGALAGFSAITRARKPKMTP